MGKMFDLGQVPEPIGEVLEGRTGGRSCGYCLYVGDAIQAFETAGAFQPDGGHVITDRAIAIDGETTVEDPRSRGAIGGSGGEHAVVDFSGEQVRPVAADLRVVAHVRGVALTGPFL